MRVLVIGNLGMLARDLCAALTHRGHEVVGIDLPDLDITRGEQILDCARRVMPGTVVNCAAFTNVDRAESEPELCYAVNREGAVNIANACRAQQIPLIHLSTDYIFDGNTSTPYKEEDDVAPLGVYGTSKWQGEQAIRSRLERHFIIRTAWLYGVHGTNFVKTILNLARTRPEIRVVADQQGCPTWTRDLAGVLCRFVTAIQENQSPSWGTYHYCGKGITSWWAFAKLVVEMGHSKEHLLASRVTPITTQEYPTPAQRPRFSALDCQKIEKAFAVERPAWQESLGSMIEELYKG